MGFSGRERILIIAIAICLGALAGDRFIFSPLVANWNDRAGAIQELEDSLAKYELMAGRLDSISERWQEMRERSLAPSESQSENEVLSAVSRWGREARIDITSLKPRWLRDEEDYSTLDIRVIGQGSLDSLAQFLYSIESDRLPLRIENLEIRSRDDSGQLLTFDLAFTGLQLAQEDS